MKGFALHQIAQFSLFLDEEIARVDVPVMFYNEVLAAVATQVADIVLVMDHHGQEGVEKAHRNAPLIAGFAPDIEHITQELPPLAG